MEPSHTNAPPPELRIIPTTAAQAHEEHDSQRSLPLVERLRDAEVIINPPIVAPMDQSQYVILDGANRCYSFRELGYPHLLVQVAAYESGYVELDTWSHIISGWDIHLLLEAFNKLDDMRLQDGQDRDAIAHLILPEGRVIAVTGPVQSTHERNAALRHLVSIYQKNATLYRTAINEPAEIWPLYPDAIALMIFPRYVPADIIAATRYKAYLPPGISRHVIHGRALRVNYPLAPLRDRNTSLDEKNAQLSRWMQRKLAQRSVRYYAEATYQFDE